MLTPQAQSKFAASVSSIKKGSKNRCRRSAVQSGRCTLDLLESRTLLSATWSTVDHFTGPQVSSMAADNAGNVFAVGGSLIRQKHSGSTAWTTLMQSTGYFFTSVAVDAAGDVFVSGHVGSTTPTTAVILERAAGQAAFTVVDSSMLGEYRSFAFDAAGDLFVDGVQNLATGTVTTGTGKNKVTTTTYTAYGVVRERLAGQATFATVNQIAGNQYYGLTAVDGNAAAGVYVVGTAPATSSIPAHWTVLKSTMGASGTWSQVDSYQAEPSRQSGAKGIAADSQGNLYVVGEAAVTTSTGAASDHWITRESSDGGATWSVVDNYQLSTATLGGVALAVGSDLAGNMYVVGEASGTTPGIHGVIRTNASGTWTTVNDVPNYVAFSAFTVDSSGTLYAGGYDGSVSGSSAWLIQSAAGPAPITQNSSLALSAMKLMSKADHLPASNARGGQSH
jgi:hypothetical protein